MTEQPDWKVSDEELMKVSPAMALGRKILSGDMSFEESADLLRNTPGVEFQDEPPEVVVNPGSTEEPFERPDHEDFRLLSRVVQSMDQVAEERGWDDVFIPASLDPASVAYMARQRVLRAGELLTEASEYDKMAVLWIDAFTLGALVTQEKSKTLVRTVLDDAIVNGSYRTGGMR